MTGLFSSNVVYVSSGCIVQRQIKESTGKVISFWASSAFGPAPQKSLPSSYICSSAPYLIVDRIQLVNPEEIRVCLAQFRFLFEALGR